MSLPAVLWVARATLRARAAPQCRRTAERLRLSNLRTGKQRQADKTARAALLGQRYTACAMMCKQGYMRAHCVMSSIDSDCIRVWRGLASPVSRLLRSRSYYCGWQWGDYDTPHCVPCSDILHDVGLYVFSNFFQIVTSEQSSPCVVPCSDVFVVVQKNYVRYLTRT